MQIKWIYALAWTNESDCIQKSGTVLQKGKKTKTKFPPRQTQVVNKSIVTKQIHIKARDYTAVKLFNFYWVDMISGNLGHPFCSRNNINSIESVLNLAICMRQMLCAQNFQNELVSKDLFSFFFFSFICTLRCESYLECIFIIRSAINRKYARKRVYIM